MEPAAPNAQRSLDTPVTHRLSFGDVVVDLAGRKLWLAGELREATPLVFRLLDYFVRHPRRLISHQELLENVWAPKVVEHGAIKRSIADLRRLLGEASPATSVIRTVPREGYVLEADPTPPEPEVRPEAVLWRRWRPVLVAVVVVVGVVLLSRVSDDRVAPVVSAIAVAASPTMEEDRDGRRLAGRLRHALFLQPQWRVVEGRVDRTGPSGEPRSSEEQGRLLLRGHGTQFALLVSHTYGDGGSVLLRGELRDLSGTVRQLEARGESFDLAASGLIESVAGALPGLADYSTEAAPSEAYDTGAIIDAMLAGEFDRAIEALEERVSAEPDDGWARSTLARAQLSRREPAAVLETAEALIAADAGSRHAADAMLLMAEALIVQRELGEAQSRLEQAENLYRALGAFTGLGKVQLAAARLAERRGEHGQADLRYEQAFESFASAGNEMDMMVARVNFASFLERSGRASLAVPYFRHSLASARELGLGNATRIISANLSLALRKTGNWNEAQGLAQDALDLAERQGQRASQAIYRLTLAILASDRGELDDAASQLRQALVIASETSEPRILAAVISMQGALAEEQGLPAAAAAFYAEALNYVHEGSARELDIRLASAAMRCATSERSEGRDRLRELLREATDRELARERAAGLFYEARYCAATHAEAIGILREGLSVTATMDEPALAALMRTELGYLLALERQYDQADTLLQEALVWKPDFPDALALRAVLDASRPGAEAADSMGAARAAVGQRVLWLERLRAAEARRLAGS